MTHLGFSALAAAAIVAWTPLYAASFDEMFPEHPGYETEGVDEILDSYEYRQGRVTLLDGKLELNIPDGYYYLDSADAESVLSDLWGNPPAYTLGMIFPVEYTPWDEESWGADLNFEEIGYVSDEDAETYDYDALLKEMQAELLAESREREKMGYGTVELLGWAQTPSYDRTTRKLHWAQELRFNDEEATTLNYYLRALGRDGVMVANFIGSMEQFSEIKSALPDVAAMVVFTEGNRYADFDPSVDKVAAVGIAGLIAGKALTSKAGFAALAILFLKKFWFLLLLPFAWLGKALRRS